VVIVVMSMVMMTVTMMVVNDGGDGVPDEVMVRVVIDGGSGDNLCW
jgi:hypothetical protein